MPDQFDYELINSSDNGNPPDKLNQAFPKINRNMAKAKILLESQGNRLDNILADAGESNVEIVDARLNSETQAVSPTLGQRLNADYKKLQDEIAVARTENISPSRIPYNTLSYNVFDISADSKKLRLVNMSEEVLQAMAGNAPINAVPADGSLTNAKYAPASITLDKLAYVPAQGKRSRNLFNKNNVTQDQYVQWQNGVLAANTSYVATEYISVKPSTDYTLNIADQLAFFDSNKTYISGVNSQAKYLLVTTPANAAYIRISVKKTNLDKVQLEEGNTPHAVEYYGALVEETHLETTLRSKLNKRVFQPNVASSNLFDKKDTTDGVFVDWTTGLLSANANFAASGFIEVLPNTDYTFFPFEQIAWFGPDKQYISGVNGSFTTAKTYTSPASAAYVRVSLKKADMNKYKLEQGTAATAYQPFGGQLEVVQLEPAIQDKLNNLLIPSRASVNMFNKATATAGFFVDPNTGDLSASSSYYASDWIPVAASTTYSVSYRVQIAWYDSNKTFISGASAGTFGTPGAWTSPANAAYARITTRNADINVQQMQVGSLTAYEPYGIRWVSESQLASEVVAKLISTAQAQKINDALVPSRVSVNLFDKTKTTLNFFVDPNNGNLAASTSYQASDWIPVAASTTYSVSHRVQIAWYDSNKTFISGASAGTYGTPGAWASPANAAFARITIRNQDIDVQQMQVGSLTAYEAYGARWIGESQLASEVTAKFITTAQAQKINDAITPGQTSRNLFNKATATAQKFVDNNTGSLGNNTNYHASDYIPVAASTLYTFNKFVQLAWYDVNKTFISGATTGTYGVVKSFTSPSTAAFVRVTIRNADINAYQVEVGGSFTFYEDYGLKWIAESQLSKDVQNKLNTAVTNSPFVSLKQAINALHDPFVKTIIKCIGDSITHGMGGTGYAQDGDVIYGGWRVNTAGYCWANLLRNYVADKFNKDHVVPVVHPKVTLSSGVVTDNSGNYETGVRAKLQNTDTITFTFYGDHLSVYYGKNPDNGNFKIFVDGNDTATINASDTVTSYRNVYDVVGLTLGQHTIIIQNVSGASYIEGLKIPKTAQVINYGTSGNNSNGLRDNITTLVKDTDDIVICMIGTNDRNNDATNTRYPASLKRNLRYIVDHIKSRNKKIILMSSVPASISNETGSSPAKFFHMEDVDNAISGVAGEYSMEYISLYEEWLDYCDLKGVTVDSMLADGLHPNDAGYLLMWKMIMRRLGLGRKRDNATW